MSVIWPSNITICGRDTVLGHANTEMMEISLNFNDLAID